MRSFIYYIRKLSEKLTFLTPWFAHVRTRIRGKEMFVFRKLCGRTKQMIPKVKSSHITTGADESRQSEKVSICSRLNHWKSLLEGNHGLIIKRRIYTVTAKEFKNTRRKTAPTTTLCQFGWRNREWFNENIRRRSFCCCIDEGGWLCKWVRKQ